MLFLVKLLIRGYKWRFRGELMTSKTLLVHSNEALTNE